VWAKAAAAALAVAGLTSVGCSSIRPAAVDPGRIAEAVEILSRPLPGDLAALYRLRVVKSGGLRLAVVTAGSAGRLTISEQFGSAVSLTAWSRDLPTFFFDMHEGCRREIKDLEEVLGLGSLPLEQAMLLLGGRLPAAGNDVISVGGRGEITVGGSGWSAAVELAADPWRVVEVREAGATTNRGWRLELSDHTSSVPGAIRLVHSDGRWAELELARMEWPEAAVLPDLPLFPPCDGRRP
jgi:hypothetical protein